MVLHIRVRQAAGARETVRNVRKQSTMMFHCRCTGDATLPSDSSDTAVEQGGFFPSSSLLNMQQLLPPATVKRFDTFRCLSIAFSLTLSLSCVHVLSHQSRNRLAFPASDPSLS